MSTKLLAIVTISLATTMIACNSGSKTQTQDGWVIKNEVKNIEVVDLEQIADVVDVVPIVSREPIAQIESINGSVNDFIACSRWQTFYHVKDGHLVDKLNAVGNGHNEYNQLLQYSYLPADSLFYGYDNSGKLMCYKTSPFKFESVSPIDIFPHAMHVLGRDKLLFIAFPPINECETEVSQVGEAIMTKIKDSCVVYSFDGQTLTKMFCVAKTDDNNGQFTRTDNGVLMSLLMPQYTLYRYADNQVHKIATIDYGKMEMPEPEEKVEMQGDMVYINIVINGDYSTGCNFPQLSNSTLAYWYYTFLNDKRHSCLAIATPESVNNYEIHIGGLNCEVHIDMVDNGVYSMLIQGDYESIINQNEELSPLGKRIIDVMKGNDFNPIVLQFKLKAMN